jgi:hypothetical protein
VVAVVPEVIVGGVVSTSELFPPSTTTSVSPESLEEERLQAARVKTKTVAATTRIL